MRIGNALERVSSLASLAKAFRCLPARGGLRDSSRGANFFEPRNLERRVLGVGSGNNSRSGGWWLGKSGDSLVAREYEGFTGVPEKIGSTLRQGLLKE